MASDPAATDWTADGLARLWLDYAAGLAELNEGSAERFRTEVLGPWDAGNLTRAVTAWVTDWSEPLQFAQAFSPADLARLRKELGELVEKLQAPPKASRWFSRESHSLATPETKALLADVNRALDTLSRPQSQNAAALRESLAATVREVNALLEAAPPTWPPAATLFAPRLLKALKELPTEAEPFLPHARQMATFDPNADEPTTLVLALLDALAASSSGPLGKLSPKYAVWLDRVLGCVRGWAAGHGVEVMPSTWSFQSPSAVGALRQSGVTLAAVYRTEEPLGSIIRIKSFGITHREQLLRPAVVSVSAGAAPAGLVELEESLIGSNAELQEHLREWRTASLEGRLESAAVEAFVLYWDRHRNSWIADQPEIAAQFDERFSAFLIENFGLAPFYPSSFQDRPAGWLQPADGTRMTTGRVREVLRPGLADRDGELRVPARVTVE